jgi:type VI secretion system secreted protein Hcp
MTALLVLAGVLAVLLPTRPASAQAYSLVAVIETQTQGSLDCGNVARGQEGTQVLLGVSDEISLPSPEAPASAGLAFHVKPFVFIKELDRCSPPLFRALVTRETLPRVEIRLFDRHRAHFFTIRLEQALVTRIARVVRQHGLHEEVAFIYRTLSLTEERTGQTASHDFSR